MNNFMSDWIPFKSKTPYETLYRIVGNQMEVRGVWAGSAWDTYEKASLDEDASKILSMPFDLTSILPAGFKAFRQTMVNPMRLIEFEFGKFINTIRWLTTIQIEPDGFYNIVSTADTVEGGIHVVEVLQGEDIDALKAENERLRRALRTAFTYGLPPDDASGRAEWNRARAALEER